jgi:hypothetical protein
MPDIQIKEYEKHPRERWIRFRAASFPQGCAAAGILTSNYVPGHRWRRVQIRDGDKESRSSRHSIKSGRAVNVSLIIRYSNDRLPKWTDEQLITLAEEALALSRGNEEADPTRAAPFRQEPRS